MGRRVCAIASRDLPDLRLVRAARGIRPTNENQRQADHTDRESLLRAFDGIDCVINAAGPYRYYPRTLLEASLESGCHYIDLAESPAYHASVASTAIRLQPEKHGLAWVPGASTVPGLIELLIRHWATDAAVAQVKAYLSMGSRNPTSRTLIYSLFEPLSGSGPGRAPDGSAYFSSTLTRTSPDGKTLRYGRYAFPRDAESAPRARARLPLEFYVGFDRSVLVRALAWSKPILSRLSERSLGLASALSRPAVGALSVFGSRAGRLEVVAIDHSGKELGASWVIAPSEGLDIPAAPAVWAAAALLGTGDQSHRSGVLGLADLVSAQHARSWLAQHGYIVGERWG